MQAMPTLFSRTTAATLLVLAVPAFSAISPKSYLDDVKFLASEDMRGRGTGTPQLEKAAKYISHEFKKAGLQTLDGKSYEQSFTVSINSHLGPNNYLEFTLDGKTEKLK